MLDFGADAGSGLAGIITVARRFRDSPRDGIVVVGPAITVLDRNWTGAAPGSGAGVAFDLASVAFLSLEAAFGAACLDAENYSVLCSSVYALDCWPAGRSFEVN